MVQTQNPLLIIFYRNPRLGEVKTRLASTVGKEKALAVYKKLAAHTKEITTALNFEKIVFYSDSVDLMDMWPNATYLKTLQNGDDLGQRMRNALAAGFESGYDAICIIGTDCFQLTPAIIEQAFITLHKTDAVIGPAVDGGYYLLGMRSLHEELFRDKNWSTETVCRDTIQDFEALKLSYMKLPVLRDVDTEDDLPEAWDNFN